MHLYTRYCKKKRGGSRVRIILSSTVQGDNEKKCYHSNFLTQTVHELTTGGCTTLHDTVIEIKDELVSKECKHASFQPHTSNIVEIG